ncbi:family 43 glycosylhydrolase [Actinomadura sp. 3N407]|uniref:family 43 glycosylhydrolase n=1 Tax=Actinomadura sp. 3N407 TaxID=3457423 RepID=UPI003FCE7477
MAVAITTAWAGAFVAPRPASAATVDTGAWYVLVNRHSGKALDVYDLATHDGARITQWARNDGAWQQWRFVDSGGGHYRLLSRHSGKVLDVYGFSTEDRAPIVQWADHNGVNQQFRLADSDGGHVRLINRNSGKAVDVLDHSTADGAQVVQYTDLGGANQQWRLVKVDDSGTPPASYPNPGVVTGDIGVHDPSMVKRPEGGYLTAYTGRGLPLKTSGDRTAFRNAGAAFPDGTPWTGPYTPGNPDLWAPDLSYHIGRYYLYYSASTFGSNHSAIFLATSSSGASGTWTNHGPVIESRTSDDFNAIDPNLIVDDQGRWWLSFGSFWSGIKLVRLDPATGLRSDGTMRAIAGRGGGAIEAPYMFKHGSYYYLYVSFDLCCRGASSTYRVMVGRSASPVGPFLDRDGVPMTDGGGTEVLAGHGGVHGPGHQAVLADTDGDVLVYHYYADNGASLLGINYLGYDDAGWPYVH